MKIWVSNKNETLRRIAELNGFAVEELIALNPGIDHADQIITGRTVYLPVNPDADRDSGASYSTTGGLPMCPSGPKEMLNHWIPLTPLEQMAQQEYDVLIIGTGAGGGSVLWRLCEQWKKQRKRIGIIERGDSIIPTHARNLTTMNEERLTAYFNYLSKPLRGSEPEFKGARQLFALGGRTLFWYAFSPRLYPWDLAKWPVSVQEMQSYYGIAEQIMHVSRSFAEGSSFTEIVLQRLWMRGYPYAAPLPIAADIVPSTYGQLHTDTFTSSISLLARALNLRPYDLAVNARALQILHHNGRVTGVKVASLDKKEYTLKAKTVVVCASTFETPRLLMYSGIQNKALGHYLTTQSFIQATGETSTRNFPIPWGPLNVMIPQTEQRPYSVLLTGPEGFYWYPVALERPISTETTVNFYGYGKVSPRFDNRISLNYDKRDEFGVPEIKVHFSFSDEDWSVVRQMEAGIRRIAADAGIRLVSRNGNPPICLTPFGDLHHDSGTCRIGNDPNTSAANPYGNIHGVSGLYAADNSVLPFIGAENNTLTTIAQALRTADHIVREHGSALFLREKASE
ncbi:GMC oxidoreductase [Paenibacillus rigui]|uniref:2-keto-gluconate dehydrogenase n=1 Tax=Paenibacillus rigui TaxID=554312 RepID=A0A229UK61_9BACL|nr:GMC family oxidoreductase [Paenibacillus rigui]OXM83837.1 2-keto-gluconate dehydrogenase [Paenibacillus rigui]